jgi:hypothetical protein
MPDYKYSFESPEYQELQILDQRKERLGKIRIKPSTILWKPANGKRYYSVSIDDFAQWIMRPRTGAKKTKL